MPRLNHFAIPADAHGFTFLYRLTSQPILDCARPGL
jgi:hypothetical protein